MNELLTMSVSEMARRIRKGELSPVEAVSAHIERIEKVNPKLNAVVVSCFEEARREAAAAEEQWRRSREDLPPLFGVPCTIKDTYAVKGYPWSVGVWARRETAADFDATVVARVKKAGAIVLGKTNVPEAAMWCESYNHIYGRTNNPYDLRRTVGGSSGGEGAIVAAGGSPFGIGSDIGGSIRYPSAFNGVAGHKPTGGLVPGTGHWPPTTGPLARYNTYGPLGRRVSDLALLLSILAGPDGQDLAVEDRPVLPPESVDRKKLKVFYFDDNGFISPDAEVKRAVALAAGALAAEGLPVEFWIPKGAGYALEIWSAGLAQNPGPPFKAHLGGGQPISVGREFLRFLGRQSKITGPSLLFAAVEWLAPLLAGRHQKMLALARDLQLRIEEKLGDHGVLICPVFPSVAPFHHQIWLNAVGAGYSGLINVLHFPATIIPIFHRPDGLPVAVQVVAGRFRDHLTLAAAGILEAVFGGWKPPERIGS